MEKIKVLLQTESNKDSGYDYILSLLNKDNSLNFGVDSVIKIIIDSGGVVSDHGLDFMLIGIVVYFADKHISRDKNSQDSWTREIDLTIPVSEPKLWEVTKRDVILMLNFLTGDIWSIVFSKRKISVNDVIGLQNINMLGREVDTVSLFSGGMDSLISTINYLTAEKKLLLISHASDPTTKSSQNKVRSELSEYFGENFFNQITLWTDFSSVTPKEKEKTTRSRSFLFISLAVFTSQSFANVQKIEIPENGLIALNIPLDSLRIGAHTTRTTHPYYLNLWNDVLSKHNFDFRMNNSYWSKTKGEMALECANKELLAKILPLSSSCSSSTKARFSVSSPDTHCGHCVPCLVRRAAIFKGIYPKNDETEYVHNIPELLVDKKDRGLQLKSFLYAIDRVKCRPHIAKVLIHGTGNLKGDHDYLRQLESVYSRGMFEVDDFIRASGKLK